MCITVTTFYFYHIEKSVYKDERNIPNGIFLDVFARSKVGRQSIAMKTVQMKHAYGERYNSITLDLTQLDIGTTSLSAIGTDQIKSLTFES